ncbi:hypothetical protein DMN91_006425 [Ooceraea biroi]|uniref:Uncharacterized protein n=1 Tax=Ooceraea biroi TaxID=2015173 RepID=A0A3L8DP29_OOCBI|nr:hypothetical protein DMN91_006425 [Ooceraea biroi]
MSSDDTQTGWIWKLRKDQLTDELQNRGVLFSANDKRDELRALLVEIVRENNAPSEELETAKLEAISVLNSVPNASVTTAESVPETEPVDSKAALSVNKHENPEIDESFESAHSDSDTGSTMSDSSKIRFCLGKDK